MQPDTPFSHAPDREASPDAPFSYTFPCIHCLDRAMESFISLIETRQVEIHIFRRT